MDEHAIPRIVGAVRQQPRAQFEAKGLVGRAGACCLQLHPPSGPGGCYTPRVPEAEVQRHGSLVCVAQNSLRASLEQTVSGPWCVLLVVDNAATREAPAGQYLR